MTDDRLRWRSRRLVGLGVLILLWLTAVASGRERARVGVLADLGRKGEAAAAAELRSLLGRRFPEAVFRVASTPDSDATHFIDVGTAESRAKVLSEEAAAYLQAPGAYIVLPTRISGRPAARVIGADAQGLWSGVYGLLDKLGCGFYLSFDTLPAPSGERFSLDQWRLKNRPLTPLRIAFNWHNFLSGCSTWNLAEWRKWIIQTQKMGYNAVMVHAYGNNPMAGFQFQGVQKPVGYLSSTRIGRDWSTNHVNDVRRLFGGSVLDGAVFGSVASVAGSDAERTRAAQQLMAQAFQCAEDRSVKVYFAVDIDTSSANPQELITRLPESDRFDAGGFWLPRPDTPGGYAFYKAEVERLLEVYPQIDCLVAWHRTGRTPWMELPLERMPGAWREEFDAECAETPEARSYWRSPQLFAQAKIVRAFQRALRELGRDDVRTAFGSWRFAFLPAADRFLPRDTALIALDYEVLHGKSQFDSPERRAETARVAARRPVIPIAWAQHDDGNYVGRPYAPFPDFYDRLVDMKCAGAGYGVIHWTTKPLDLYFKSLVNQVWAATKNQPLEAACRRMGFDCVGRKQGDRFGRYLNRWITTAPKIGRETSDFFIDRPLQNLAEVEAGFQQRMKLLDAVDSASLTPSGREWVDYFRGLERFILDIHRTEDALSGAGRRFRDGDLEGARAAMRACKPEAVVERFAKFSRLGGLTRGEQGLIVTMNTRWITHYIRFRQQLGLEPVRVNLAPTSHDPLAQSPGVFTFHWDREQNVWETWGERETACPAFALPADVRVVRTGDVSESEAEICRTGVESDQPIELVLSPMMKRDSRGSTYKIPPDLPAGLYRLTLLALSPPDSDAARRLFDVAIFPAAGGRAADRFDPVRAKYLRVVCRGNSVNSWNSICEIRCAAIRPDQSGAEASGQVKQYEASKAVDGDPRTRWAAEGPHHWIQFRLDPKQSFDRVAIDWYEGGRRAYDYTLQTSDDGKRWVELTRRPVPRPAVVDRIELEKQAGGPLRVFKRTYEVRLDRPGSVRVVLTPREGKAALCGVRVAAAN